MRSRRRGHEPVAMTFVGLVDHFNERVCVVPGGFGVFARTGRVPLVTWAPVRPEVVPELLARSGNAPWL